jgi:FkbM family methyltransferase
MNEAKRWMEELAARLGYTVVPNWRMPRRSSAEYLKRLFDWLRIDLVLDVGANLGQFRDYLRLEVGYTGKLISWEPVPAIAQLLRKRAAGETEWRVIECALGRAPGRVNLHVTRSSQFSSIHRPTAEAAAGFQAMTQYEDTEVEVRTLAGEFRQIEDWSRGRRVYLKLDTQGNDLDVLEGAGDALEAVDALQSEVAVRPIYEGVPELTQSLTRIRALGFEPSGVFPNNEGHFPWLLELDMHFVARRHMPPSFIAQTGALLHQK